VEKQTTELETHNSNLAFKGNEEAEATDILIPRILLMQGTSKWVPDTFNMGDLINSVEEELLAAKGKKITIIPFVMKKTWQIFTDEQTPQWVRQETWNAANDNADWQFEEEDPDRGVVQLKRQRNYGFYCLIVGEDGTIDPFSIPAQINFRSSSGFKEGKKIASHFGVMKSMQQPGFTVAWDIGTESVKDGDKSYQKFIVKKARNTTKEEMEPIYKWLTLMETQADRFTEHSEAEETETTVTGQAPKATTDAPRAQF